MKASAKINYPVEDVFQVFIKAAKKDFKDFNEDDPIGCKVVKKITSGGSRNPECTVEITDYVVNGKYQITTSNDKSSCVSTYKFVQKKEGYTVVSFEESQGGKGMMDGLTLMIIRFMAKRAFKQRFEAQMENLRNELNHKEENLKRSEKKTEA